MNIKKKIEENILIVLAGCCITVGGIVYAITNYFNVEKHSIENLRYELKIQDLESKFASIKRNLPNNDYFDIRKLILNSEEATQIVLNSKYCQEDRFYAINKTSFWEYSKTDKYELIHSIYGEDYNNPIDVMLNDLRKSYPIHLWKNEKSYYTESSKGKVKLFPFIELQKVSYNSVQKLIGNSIEISDSLLKSKLDFIEHLNFSNSNSEEVINNLSKWLFNDIAWNLFFCELAGEFFQSTFFPDIKYKLISLQSVGNIQYSQALREYVNLDQRQPLTKKLYNREELIIICTIKYIYIIKISIPSLSPIPSTEDYAQVLLWLSNFKVIID